MSKMAVHQSKCDFLSATVKHHYTDLHVNCYLFPN